MELLIFAQTLFYLTVSFAILVLSTLFGLIVYYLMRITRDLSAISNNFSGASDDLRTKLEEILERITEIPFLSSFMRTQASGKRTRKGRGE